MVMHAVTGRGMVTLFQCYFLRRRLFNQFFMHFLLMQNLFKGHFNRCFGSNYAALPIYYLYGTQF